MRVRQGTAEGAQVTAGAELAELTVLSKSAGTPVAGSALTRRVYITDSARRGRTAGGRGSLEAGYGRDQTRRRDHIELSNFLKDRSYVQCV